VILKRLSIATALLLALGALLAGCGSDTEEDFKEEFEPLNQRIVDVGEQVGRSVRNFRGTSNAELASDFNGYADELAAVSEELDALEPPDDERSDFNKLKASVEEQERNLRGIARAGEEDDPKAVRRPVEQLLRDSPKLRDARRALVEATGAKEE
jgi:hypothetical protein